MNDEIGWLAAEAETGEDQEPSDRLGSGCIERNEMTGRYPASNDESQNPHFWQNRPETGHPVSSEKSQSRNPHFWRKRPEMGHPVRFPGLADGNGATVEQMLQERYAAESYEEERERRIYRGRPVAMLRRYMKYSIETGRLPSLLGREFFRAKVTSYTVVTFEDRVIFVHDMEKCLGRLDEFSQQLLARHILQEHDQVATARLLQCTERTVRRLTPLALDLLSEILLEMGLMERLDARAKKSCQGGPEGPFSVSDCEDSENKF